MVLIPIIQVLNQVCLKALYLVLCYFSFSSMIWKEIKCNIKLFADGTMHVSTVKNPEMSSNDDHDLDVIRQWRINGN